MSAQPALNQALDLAFLDEEASETAFVLGLMIEHLEEAGFLYDQRRTVLLDDPEISWSDLDDFEDRFEAHIDGLVLGEDLALVVCRKGVEEGDAGALHAAVRVYCRCLRRDLLDEALDGLDGDDPERVQAVRDALRDDLPPEWESDLISMLGAEEPWRRQVSAHVIGYRRMPAGEALMAALQEADPAVLAEVIRALGRLRQSQVRQPLYYTYLNHEDGRVREAAALALLRLGEPAVMRHLLTRERDQPWAVQLVGLGATTSELRFLLDVAREDGASAEALVALGLLGDPEVVEALLYHLEEPGDAEAAAIGLNLVTGADLHEEIFVSEEMEDDELFEDERELRARGKTILRPDGAPFGTTVVRLSQDVQAWRAWWGEHRGQFQPGIRYRNGKPCAPACLLEALEAEHIPRLVRRLAYEELVVRYGIDVPFEDDYPVSRQRQVLAALSADVSVKGSSFREGRWFFAGTMSTR